MLDILNHLTVERPRCKVLVGQVSLNPLYPPFNANGLLQRFPEKACQEYNPRAHRM